MGLSSIINSKERKVEKRKEEKEKREKKRDKEREKRKKREKERQGEKRREKERKGEKNMFRVNYQSAFNSKKKLNILAEMLEISKSGCGSLYIYNRPPSL